ncbi:unnamed protein product [Adineta ricciae]|uniref:Uncharacterized protein n=2 Tax=Adineta ricciae TaxID=249248 RepID=A0A814P4G2_ADIRI|nr:unnamed protein product [Adineta ricciae]
MMMTMDQPSASGFGDFGGAYASDPFASNQSSSPPIGNDPDVDWSVFENAERYLLRDDSAWITRLSKDFWWNLDRISEMITHDIPSAQQMNNRPNQQKFNQQSFLQQSAPPASKPFPPQAPNPMQFTGVPPRKIVGQRAGSNAFRNPSMFNGGFASPPPSSSSSSSSSGSTIVRPPNTNLAMNTNFNIPDKSSFFQAFSSMSLAGGSNDQDIEYNPFQSKISFDNNMWGNNSQQPIPWQ